MQRKRGAVVLVGLVLCALTVGVVPAWADPTPQIGTKSGQTGSVAGVRSSVDEPATDYNDGIVDRWYFVSTTLPGGWFTQAGYVDPGTNGSPNNCTGFKYFTQTWHNNVQVAEYSKQSSCGRTGHHFFQLEKVFTPPGDDQHWAWFVSGDQFSVDILIPQTTFSAGSGGVLSELSDYTSLPSYVPFYDEYNPAIQNVFGDGTVHNQATVSVSRRNALCPYSHEYAAVAEDLITYSSTSSSCSGEATGDSLW
jgi:hypothetical protein